MALVTAAVAKAADLLHLPDPVHAGVRRTVVAAVGLAAAGVLSYAADHAVDLHLTAYQVALVGVALQGVSKWRRTAKG